MSDEFSDYSEWVQRVSQWQDQVQPIPAMVKEDINKSRMKVEDAARGLQSLMFDPLAVQYAMGYKDRKYSLTYDVLKKIPHQLAIVGAILQTRCNQVAQFSVPFRASKSVGFTIKHKDPSHLTSKSELEFIKDLERFIYQCGQTDPNPHNNIKRDDFEAFLKKIVRDSLLYDQACAEIVPDRRGQPYEFMAVDASTIRIAASNSVFGPNQTYHSRSPAYSGNMLTAMAREERGPYRMLKLYDGKEKQPDFVQVVNGQIENVYTREELAFGVRNPRTDIYIQGYGYGELEQLVTIVTAHLYAEEYNRRFFMQGCVAGDTPVHTEHGITPIQSLVGTVFRVWNGEEFVDADAVYSGEKRAVRTRLNNDQEIVTSSDHKFLSFDEEGNMRMVPISEMKPGMYVAQADSLVEFSPLEDVRVKKRVHHQLPVVDAGPLDSEFYEFIGWLVGDGYISKLKRSKESSKHNYTVSCVFGPKDQEAKNKFTSMLDARGIAYYMRKSGGAWGGREIDTLVIRNEGLFTFLRDVVGVSENKSTSKTVPARVFRESVPNRAAFLRGLFSADGFIKNGYNAHFCSSSKELVWGVQQILWSLGVHSTLSHTIRNASGNMCYYLRVSNNQAFADIVGFLLSHKKQSCLKRDSLGKIPRELQRSLYSRIYGKKLPNNRWLTRRDLIRLANNNNIQLDALKYRWVKINEIIDTKVFIPTYDIRQEHHKHQWSTGGCVVSNSAPKGILNFKGDAMTPDMLEGFRRQWRSSLEGVENCLAGSTRIYTRESGFVSLEELCGDRAEVPVQLWTGTSWESGLVYKTQEPKVLCRTVLDTGVEVSSSPDHKFRVIGEDGFPSWKVQSDLMEGDTLLLNKKDPSLDTELYCLGKKATPELMEVLGWFLGDGNVSYKTNDRGYSAGAQVTLFYNNATELDIRDRHLGILQEFFPAAYKNDYVRSEESIKDIKQKYGFKSVQNVVSSIRLSDISALRWLESHGFISNKKKSIPSNLFLMPSEYRAAFLRGLFSADGNNARGRTPELTCASDSVRGDVQQLLLSLGIRTAFSEGTSIINPSTKRKISKSHKLSVKDRTLFFRSIGFLQTHKQPKTSKAPNEIDKSDSLPRSAIVSQLNRVREANKKSGYTLLSERQRMDLNAILAGSDGCSKGRVTKFLSLVGLDVPSWFEDYHTAKVKKVLNTGVLVPMFDVSVDHEDHMFVGENVLISNSWKTPILQSEQGVEWIDLHPSNREMEYNAWMEYLIKVTCFTESTPVTFGDGSVRPISEITPGDEVVTLSGSVKPVNNVQITDYEGPLHHIRAGSVIEITPEHPMFVAPSRIVNGVREVGEPEWKNAEDVTEGTDYLVIPKKTYQREGTVTEIDLADYLEEDTFRLSEEGNKIAPKSNRVTWVNRYITLDEESAFVLGLYFSEGNTTDYATFFTFAAEEVDYVGYVEAFSSGMGLHSKPYKAKDSTVNIRVHSSLFAKALSSMFGRRALEKKIPKEILKSSKSVQKAFISGALAGDGSVFKSGNVNTTISLASEEAIEQLRYLFFCQDIYTHKYDVLSSGFGRNGKPTKMYRLDVFGPQLKKLSKWMFGPKGDKLRTVISDISDRSKIHETPSYFFVPVSEHWIEDFKGKVYNIEVDEEHTYQAHRFGVHNCATFLIDPAELNFDLHGGVQQTPLFESSQEWKLKASRDRGLKPLLRFIAKMINEHIISKIDDHFVFDFVGLDELTEQEKHTLRTEQVASYLTLNEVRRQEDLPDLEYGDMPMSPAYIQAMQAKQAMEAQEQQQQQPQMAGGETPEEGAEGGAEGAGEEEVEAPEYADGFGKSLSSKSGDKYLEIDLDDWIDKVRP